MNDEIKEILDKLNYLVKNEMSWWENYTVFSPKDTKQLLDYITNLQQENEYLKKNQRFHKKFGNDYIFCVEGDKETYKDLLLEKQEELEIKDNIMKELKEWIRNFTNDSNEWDKLIYDEYGDYGIENTMILDKIKELEDMYEKRDKTL